MKKKFIIEGLGCANCAAKMEAAINKLNGVKEANINFMTQKLVIDAEEEQITFVIEEADKIIRGIEPGTRLKKA